MLQRYLNNFKSLILHIKQSFFFKDTYLKTKKIRQLIMVNKKKIPHHQSNCSNRES